MKQLLKIYSLIALLSGLVAMLFIAIPWENLSSKDLTVVVSFLLNGTVWGVLLFCELSKRAYSLLIIHWLFCFLFFFAIAFTQYMHGVFPWVGSLGHDILLQTNFILLAWTAVVWVGYKGSFTKNKAEAAASVGLRIPQWLVLSLTCFTVSNTVYRVVAIGFSALLARATSVVSYGMESSAAGMFVGHSIQALSFFAAVFSLLAYRQKRRGLLFVMITMTCLLISYFPTSMARYAAAAIYGGLLLIVFRSLRSNRLFILSLLGGFLIVLPFLNAFRNTSFLEVNISNVVANVFHHLGDAWLSGDYDAYTLLVLVLEHIKFYGITWGMQFVGVLLFWIPRAWWIAKPVGTGHFITTQAGWYFTNVSAPLPAEGLINLGQGGYLLFALFVGWLMGKLDRSYWKKAEGSSCNITSYSILYPVLIMFFFFMNRGDLLSSTAYTMAYVVNWWLLCKCCQKVKL